MTSAVFGGRARIGMLHHSLRLRFDAETHPDPTARASAWREAMSLSVDVEFAPGQVEGFSGRLDIHPLGAVLLVEAQATAHGVARTRHTIARSGDSHLILDVFRSGSFVGTVGARSLVIGPGDGVVLDLGQTMRLRLEPYHYLGVVIPKVMVRTQTGSTRALHGLHLPAGCPEVDLLGGVLACLAAQAPRLARSQAVVVGLGLVDMVGACLGSPGRQPEQGTPVSHGPDIGRVRRHIARYAADPTLDPDTLARAFGVSRAGLYRLFRPAGGVAEAIRLRRAEIARRLLGAPGNEHRTNEQIARLSGFADVRTLTRVLREVYAATPSQLRGLPVVASPTTIVDEIGAMFDAVGEPGARQARSHEAEVPSDP